MAKLNKKTWYYYCVVGSPQTTLMMSSISLISSPTSMSLDPSSSSNRPLTTSKIQSSPSGIFLLTLNLSIRDLHDTTKGSIFASAITIAKFCPVTKWRSDLSIEASILNGVALLFNKLLNFFDNAHQVYFKPMM